MRTKEVEKVLEEEKEENLRRHRLQRGERHLVRLHPQALRRRVEQPNLHHPPNSLALQLIHTGKEGDIQEGAQS